MQFSRGQTVILERYLPFSSAPTLTSYAYVAPEQWVGDALDAVLTTVSGGYPVPALTNTLTVGGVAQSIGYTLQLADLAATIALSQGAVNSVGSAVSSSSTTVLPTQTAQGQGLLGGNISGVVDYSKNQFLNNAGQATLLFFPYNTTTGTVPIDSNGWPTTSFSMYISRASGGLNGQLEVNTYLRRSYRSVGQATNIIPATCSGCTVSNIIIDGDGVTTYFDCVVPQGTNVYLSFDGPVQYLDFSRDPTSGVKTWGASEFWPTSLAHYSQFPYIRLMDICAPNVTETTWSDGFTRRPELGTTQPCMSTSTQTYSWARICRLINALTSYSGSAIQSIHITPPGLIDPSVVGSNNYAIQLPTLINSVLGSNPVALWIELGDEQWNFQFNIAPANVTSALVELQGVTMAGSSGGYSTDGNPVISTIISNGDGTATVTCTTAVNALPLKGGGTFAVTNGMQLIVNDQQANSTWGAGGVTPNANPGLPGTITTVSVTGVSGNQFTYAINGGVGVTIGTASPVHQTLFIFNPTGTLISDGNSLNLYAIGNKYHCRRTYQVQQLWSTVRPQDKFVMNIQSYGALIPNVDATPYVVFPYAQFIGGGSTSWLYTVPVAPYVKPNVGGCGATALNTFVTGVTWAANAVVGDTVTISGAGTAGATLTTTVASGSSGTTLNIAAAIITTNLSATVTVTAGPEAVFTGYIAGTTLTVTATSSGTVAAGMMFNGTPATVLPNTKIISGTGSTFTVNNSQTVGSVGTPVAMGAANTDGICNALLSQLPAFTGLLAANIFNNIRYGFRPSCYEGGIDTQNQPTQQVAINTNPLMGQVITGLLDAWFQQGGKEFAAYFLAPSTFTNTSQGEWPFLQAFTDTASPKFASVLAYKTKTLAYQNAWGAPGTFGPGGSAGAYLTPFYLRGNLSFNTTNGMLYSDSGTQDRFVEFMIAVPRTRRFSVMVNGTDSVAGTVADIYVNGVLATSVGSVVLPANGNGSTNGTVPGNSTSALINLDGSSNPYFQHGACRVMIDFPANRGAHIGVFSITFTAN